MKFRFLLFTSILIFIISPISINVSSQVEIEQDVNILYEGYYGGEKPLLFPFDNRNLTIPEDSPSLELDVYMEDPNDPNSFLEVLYNKSEYFGYDEIFGAFGLGHVDYVIEFGLISIKEWDTMEMIVADIGEKSNWTTSLTQTQRNFYSDEDISTMKITMKDMNDTLRVDLSYEANTGLLVSGFFQDYTGEFFIEFTNVNGDPTWFEQYPSYQENNVNSSTVDSNITSSAIIFWIFFFSLVLIGILFLRYSLNSTDSEPDSGLTTKSQTKPVSNSSRAKKVGKNQEFINLPGYHKKVRVCCSQTARLNEKYCPCGRAVSEDLRDYYNSN